MTDNVTSAPDAAASAAPIDPAPQATAPVPAVVASTPATDAAPHAVKKGFLASLLGSQSRIADLEGQLAAAQSRIADLETDLAASQASVAEFEEMEFRLEKEAAAASAAATAATEAAASVPHKVAEQVRDVVATLGVEEEKLVPVQESLPAKGEEFSHLKGRARAAAAFNAQLAH